MRIGIFTDCYRPTKNGVVTSVIHLKEGLEQRGHRVSLFTVTSPQYVEHDATIHRFPSIPFNPNIEIRLGLVSQRIVNRIVQQEQLDILHTHTEFSLGWAARRAAQLMRLPLVHTAHTMYETYRHYLLFGKYITTKMIQGCFAWFLRHHNALICPSKKAQQYFTSFLPSLNTVVIGNGVSQSRFHPNLHTREARDRLRYTLGLQASDKVMLYVGRLASEKRTLELLYALTPLLQQNPGYKAVFVGDGPSFKRMNKAARENNIRPQVVLTGYVDWERIALFYSVADVFVTASLSEVHPMTVIEASLCGLLVIARRDESLTDLVKDGYNGYLVATDQQIAERAAKLLQEKSGRQRFSRNALLIARNFTIDTHIEKCEALYRQVLASKRQERRIRKNKADRDVHGTNSMNNASAIHTTFFRFYEELNDFLPEVRRKTTFAYAFRGKPSIKHSIEAIGVPHTEIDVILADGQSVGFDYQMHGGERVSVYPVFESFDVTPLVRLGSKPLRDTRFVVDVHLGKLARKLRLLGFDTIFGNNLTDREIVDRSVQEQRIILTRDKGILKYRAVTHGYWIRHDEPNAQLREVVKRLQLEHSLQPFTRCSQCNGRLFPVDKKLLHNRVPPETLRLFDAFMECDGCPKIYWQGSHYERICQLIEELQGD